MIVLVGITSILFGLGCLIYSAIPDPAWYFNATMDSVNGVPYKSTQKIKFGPFSTAEDCIRASASIGALEKSVCFREP